MPLQRVFNLHPQSNYSGAPGEKHTMRSAAMEPKAESWWKREVGGVQPETQLAAAN